MSFTELRHLLFRGREFLPKMLGYMVGYRATEFVTVIVIELVGGNKEVHKFLWDSPWPPILMVHISFLC